MAAAQPESDLAALSRIVASAPPAAPEEGGAAALFTSIVLHALIIGLVLIVGFNAVGEARKKAAPLLVADWTPPPPPPAVFGAPPQLPVPGGARVVAGPASRNRTDDAAAAASAAQQLARLEPAQRAALEARPARFTRTLGFGAAPTDSPRSAGFAGDRHRVAFVVDASGPMVGVLQAAQRELSRRLAQLTPDQQYVVIVVRGDGCETVPQTPALATRASIERTLRWLGERTEPRGKANLAAGLECAWKAFSPDGVCIIARGTSGARARVPAADGSAATASSAAVRSLVAVAERLNPQVDGHRAATFLCVELMDAAADSPLRTVGRTHGGPSGYLLLSRSDLGLSPKSAPTLGTTP